MSNRPGSSRRTSGPGFGAPAPNTGKPPGTASRLTTANRPQTRGASIPNPSVMLNPAKADDRPMTRGGLGGFQSNAGAFHRTVQDKSYFMGLLRSKITETNNEILRMNRDMTDINSDYANYQAYGRKAEELAQQIEDLMAELLDYNTLMDRLNISSNEQDIKKDYLNLKAQNDAQGKVLDELFIEKNKKEDIIKKLENEILDEKKRRTKLLTNLSGSLKSKYEKIKVESDKLQEEMESSKSLIEKYKEKIDVLKAQISTSTVKQDALALLEQLHEAEMKREQLIEETKSSMTPAEEREALLKQVKENNQEIAVIEKQINELRENIESVKRELEEQVDDVEDPQETSGEDIKKYKELKKREAQMDEFLETFEETKKNEIEQLASTRKNIVGYLEIISKVVSRNKSNEVNKEDSQYATVKLEDLHKVEKLENQVKTELENLKEKQKTMEEELQIYTDLEGLKKKAETRKQQLIVEKQNLTRYRENIKYEIEMLHGQLQAIEAKLNDNETHNQLSSLEKKLQIIEQNNYTLNENISSVTADSDYEHIKSQVLQLVSEHNKWLQEQLLKPQYDY